MQFPGQQTGERVLYSTRQHPVAKRFGYLKVCIFSLLILLLFISLSYFSPILQNGFKLLGILLTVFVFIIGWLWVNITFQKTIFYITDRRVVRFLSITPFNSSIRTLFWDEAVKCKTFHIRPLLEKLFHIGSIEIHARAQDKDNIDMHFLAYYIDLANYIDKILFTYKNQPSELMTMKSFIAKPKGQRD